ncbi:hypothetical protein [Stenotrophomonas maltophilia]|uniref:hypothetical protein n=1 Tax=Stenotrophomonas maltophilia TaxID=40324 RepID=UPI001313985A
MRARVLIPSLILGLMLVAADSKADENHACTVALCMANPDGARALAECRPPMDKLQRDLARGKAFPRCSMGGGGSTEKRGNEILFKIPGQPTAVFNWKTGESYTIPERGKGTKPPRSGWPAVNGGGKVSQEQLR